MSARRSTTAGALSVVAICLALASPATADPLRFKVIVNPDNPITTIDVGFLRNVYLKKTTEWRGGLSIRPIDLTGGVATRAHFVQHVLKKTVPQLRNYWNQRVFSGKGVPPPQVDSPAAAVAYVLANPGAVAYLPVDIDPGRAKVVEVR